MWVAGFGARHGDVQLRATDTGLHLTGADGAVAELRLPFLPWTSPAAAPTGHPPDDPHPLVAAAQAHLARHRRVAVLLVRRGGYAVAMVEGEAVTTSKVGSRYVQGRTAAGGWSQQRFARRRANQADEVIEAVAGHAVRLLAPLVAAGAPAAGGSWLITGGDRPLVDQVLADRRLAEVAALPRAAHLQIGDPKSTTVKELPRTIATVTIALTP